MLQWTRRVHCGLCAFQYTQRRVNDDLTREDAYDKPSAQAADLLRGKKSSHSGNVTEDARYRSKYKYRVPR